MLGIEDEIRSSLHCLLPDLGETGGSFSLSVKWHSLRVPWLQEQSRVEQRASTVTQACVPT